jgi:hypothetical protein
MSIARSLSRSVRAALPALAFAALFALVPASARASGAPSFRVDGDKAATLILATDAVVFGFTDLLFIGIGRPMPLWFSILQITVAGTLGPALTAKTADSPGLKVASGISALWFSAHGIYDIVRYPAYRREKIRERELERARQRCSFAIEPRPQGGVLHVRGKF